MAGSRDGGASTRESVGTNARDLARWLSTRLQLEAAEPLGITIAGQPAYQLDFSLSSTAGFLCGVPCVNLVDDGEGAVDYQYGILDAWHVRAILVDAPDGTTVLITIDDTDGKWFVELVSAAQPILDSFAFKP